MGQKYVTQPVSGFNVAPPSDDAAQTDANKIKWSGIKTKLGDPLNTAIVAIDAALVTHFAQDAILKTANYTTTASDNLKLIEVTGVNTISLLDAGTGGASYQILILNLGVGLVTVGRATAGNTINGVVGNWVLNPGTGASFRVNSTGTGYDAVGTSGSGDAFSWGGTAGGTANALTITVTPAVTAYAVGQTFRFIVGIANTGNASLSVNGLAITSIAKEGNVGLAAGDMPLGSLMQVTYGGTFFHLHRPSTANPLISANAAALVLKDTLQVLPAGLWEWQSIFGAMRLLRNTAAAGDFSTNTIPVQFGTTDIATFTGSIAGVAATFTGNVTGIDGTAATHLTTKQQLDAKVYGGRVANSGTASVAYGPSGWTVSRASAGTTTVTHNLGTPNYSAVAMAAHTSPYIATVTNSTSNSFDVITSISGANSDSNYNFVVARN